MRVNVFSPHSYTWERFAELQHQYAMARKRKWLRHEDKLDEARVDERINEFIIKEEIKSKELTDKQIINNLEHKEVLKKALANEMQRIRFEREFLENLFLIGRQIKQHVKSVIYLRKMEFNNYLLEMKIEKER